MKQLGDILRELREEKDLKQTDVAAALYISNKILSSYERNISQPPLDILKRICEYYQISADDLLDIRVEKATDPTASKEEDAKLRPDEKRLLAYYRKLSGEHREAIRGLTICFYKEQEYGKRPTS